ncbi:MAG: hypothetical protein KQI35_04775 [Bacteroidetes bacterium]|nr:hypothetical protein [Bacteroidota bacterium]
MKKAIKNILIVAILMTAPLFLLAQNPPHPNGGNAPNSGTTNIPVGGGAPIDGGLIMLIAMGSAYGARKVWKFGKDD